MLGRAGRSIDNALNSAARQASDALDSISKELYETVDDLFRKLENAFPPPDKPRYAMAGGPADFIEDMDEPFDTVANNLHRMDADTPRATDIDAPPRDAGEGQRIPDQTTLGSSDIPYEEIGSTYTLPNAEDLVMSRTVQNHINDIIKRGPNKGQLSRPYIDSNATTLLLQEIMAAAPPVQDKVLQSGLRWDVEGSFRGATGTWELVVDTSINTVVHFNFVV